MNWRIGDDTYPVRTIDDLKVIESRDLSTNEKDALDLLRIWLTGDTPAFFSSGTTGDQKVVNLSRDLIKWSIKNTTTITGKEHMVLVLIPCTRVGGAMQILRAFENENTIRVMDPSSSPLDKIPNDHDYTLTSLVPFQIYHIMEDQYQFDKFLRFDCVLIGGEPIIHIRENELLEMVGDNGPDLVHTYGMTETASHIATRRLGEVGYSPFSGVNPLVDEEGHLEIQIPGLGLRLKTSDEVNIENNGRFTLKGRNSFTVNSAGRKIRIEELEHRIHAIIGDRSPHPYALWKEPDEQLGERLILMVEEQFHFPADHLEKELTRFDHPKRIYEVKKILRNASGKVDRQSTYASISQNQK